MNTVRELFERLSGDRWRVSHPFRDDILQGNALLHNTAANEDEMAECAMLWCQRRQPCQFGKIAASEGRIHFCFLREVAVSTWTDEEIAEKIAEERQLWKQRAAFDSQRAAHSFVLIVASPTVAMAMPDKHLRAFSDRILELIGWEPNRRGVRRKNSITSDFLYLRNPVDKQFYGFKFNVDFFACAGDGSWWHDHRFPGGIAFTANSTGHMIAFRDWYHGEHDGSAWALKQAMLTISKAEQTRLTESDDPREQGRVTWLRPLNEQGNAMVGGIECPLRQVPTSLAEKDWTRYEGVLHTDHAVREEFFLDRDTPPTASRPYLMDFTYLFDQGQSDFREFTSGKPFTREEVYSEIGKPEDWTHRARSDRVSRSLSDSRTLAEQLVVCRRWEALHDQGDCTITYVPSRTFSR